MQHPNQCWCCKGWHSLIWSASKTPISLPIHIPLPTRKWIFTGLLITYFCNCHNTLSKDMKNANQGHNCFVTSSHLSVFIVTEQLSSVGYILYKPALISVNSQALGRSSASERKSSFISFCVMAAFDFLGFFAGELKAENKGHVCNGKFPNLWICVCGCKWFPDRGKKIYKVLSIISLWTMHWSDLLQISANIEQCYWRNTSFYCVILKSSQWSSSPSCLTLTQYD